VEVGKMIKVVAIAGIGMAAWTWWKVHFAHDPEHFFEADARPYFVAWEIDNCKQFQCTNAPDGSPWKDVFEADEGWVYVIATKKEPYQVALLVPRDDPHGKHLVELDHSE